MSFLLIDFIAGLVIGMGIAAILCAFGFPPRGLRRLFSKSRPRSVRPAPRAPIDPALVNHTDPLKRRCIEREPRINTRCVLPENHAGLHQYPGLLFNQFNGDIADKLEKQEFVFDDPDKTIALLRYEAQNDF